MSKTSGTYRSWVEANKGKHSFRDYLIRYSFILCSIILGFTLLTSIFNVDIFVFPIFYFGKLTIISFLIGILAVWVHLKIYSRNKDINNLIWIRRKKDVNKSMKGSIVGIVIIFALLFTFIYNYLKYESLFLAFEKVNGGYQMYPRVEIEDAASLLVIGLLIIGMVDILLSATVRRKGILIFLSTIQLAMLYIIFDKVFTHTLHFNLSAYTVDEFVFLGVYMIFVIAIVQTIITLVLRIIQFGLVLHDKMMKAA